VCFSCNPLWLRQWRTPVVPATWETEAGGSLEPKEFEDSLPRQHSERVWTTILGSVVIFSTTTRLVCPSRQVRKLEFPKVRCMTMVTHSSVPSQVPWTWKPVFLGNSSTWEGCGRGCLQVTQRMVPTRCMLHIPGMTSGHQTVVREGLREQQDLWEGQGRSTYRQ
jgi:hypothetical protein